MEENILHVKSKSFALKIINLVQLLNKNNQFVLANQILRSGTSIGANIAESEYASSKADFANKLQIAQKEAGETKYWLSLLVESEIISLEIYNELTKDVLELIRILAKSIKTSKIDN